MADTTTTAPVSPEELEKERKTLWAILKEWLDNLLNDKKAVKLFGELKEQMQDMADAIDSIDEQATENKVVLGEMVKLMNVMDDRMKNLDISDNDFLEKIQEGNGYVKKLLDLNEKIGEAQEIAKNQVRDVLKDVPDFIRQCYELKMDLDSTPHQILLVNTAVEKTEMWHENSGVPDCIKVTPNMDGTISVDVLTYNEYKKEFAGKKLRTKELDIRTDEEIAKAYEITDRPVDNFDRLIDMAGTQLKDALKCEKKLWQHKIEKYQRKRLDVDMKKKALQKQLELPEYKVGKVYEKDGITLKRDTWTPPNIKTTGTGHDSYKISYGKCQMQIDIDEFGNVEAKVNLDKTKAVEIDDIRNGIKHTENKFANRPALRFDRTTKTMEFGDYHNLDYQKIIDSEMFKKLLLQCGIDPDLVNDKLNHTNGRVAMITSVRKEQMYKVDEIRNVLEKINPHFTAVDNSSEMNYVTSHINGTDKTLIVDFDDMGNVNGILVQKGTGEYKRIVNYAKEIVAPELIDKDVIKGFNQIDAVFNESRGFETEPMKDIYLKTVDKNDRNKDTKSKDTKVNKLEGNKYINDDMMPIY